MRMALPRTRKTTIHIPRRQRTPVFCKERPQLSSLRQARLSHRNDRRRQVLHFNHFLLSPPLFCVLVAPSWHLLFLLQNSPRTSVTPTAPGQNCRDYPLAKLDGVSEHWVMPWNGDFGLASSQRQVSHLAVLSLGVTVMVTCLPQSQTTVGESDHHPQSAAIPDTLIEPA